MSEGVNYPGLDSHKRTIAVACLWLGPCRSGDPHAVQRSAGSGPLAAEEQSPRQLDKSRSISAALVLTRRAHPTSDKGCSVLCGTPRPARSGHHASTPSIYSPSALALSLASSPALGPYATGDQTPSDLSTTSSVRVELTT